MSDRWDAEFKRHQAGQRELDRLTYQTRNYHSERSRFNKINPAIEDYEPEQHLHWPEAKDIKADE